MGKDIQYDTEVIGAFPVIAEYLKKLGVARIVDELVPWEGNIPLGTLTEILILNRMLNPKALVRIGEWAGKTGVTRYYGVTAEQLNDDLLGRALERLSDYRCQVEAALMMVCIRQFGLDVAHVHFDITVAELYGSYERQTAADGEESTVPQPAYGRTKSGRKNVKQIQVGLNVTHDGGVPIGHLPLNGNAPESPVHLENLKELRKRLPSNTRLKYVADCKLDTPENLLTVKAGHGQFLCAGVFSPQLQDEFLKRRDQLQPVDYAPKSQARLPPEKRDKYLACEMQETINGEVNGRKVTSKHRVVFVWSEAKARQEKATRERHVAKIQAEFEAVTRNLNRYSLKTEKVILQRLESAKAKYSEGDLFEYTLSGRAGRYRLTWGQNAKAVERWEQLEGAYVLKTDYPIRQYPTASILAEYKSQICVEQRIHYMKGPLAVTPMFLEKPERIAGLLCIVVWALVVLSLMERQVRRSLEGKPMYGLYPENRPSPAPTGPAILNAFSTLCIVIVKRDATQDRQLAELTPVQEKLIKLLGIPPAGLRTFKSRCGT
jgi:transposase